MVSGVSRRLYWPVSGQGPGPAGPRIGSGLLEDGGFLASGVCPLVGEAGLG